MINNPKLEALIRRYIGNSVGKLKTVRELVAKGYAVADVAQMYELVEIDMRADAVSYMTSKHHYRKKIKS